MSAGSLRQTRNDINEKHISSYTGRKKNMLCSKNSRLFHKGLCPVTSEKMFISSVSSSIWIKECLTTFCEICNYVFEMSYKKLRDAGNLRQEISTISTEPSLG